jgi:serine/threonine-protein kinase
MAHGARRNGGEPVTGGTNFQGYRIIRQLGAGGMGRVFVAEKLSTHQLYAAKFLKEDYARDPTYVARFQREVGLLLSIRHPHVVNVFDWWFPAEGQEGKPLVVMELLDGEGLDELLHRQRALPPQFVVAILLQILEGLAAAHRIGVIHRDLGPSNVFLVKTATGTPLVKILDFGLARPIKPGDEADSNLTSAGTLMGKPAYVAPEMFRDLPLDERSDIFACGMMLFRMLAGRLPFRHTQRQTLWLERFEAERVGAEFPSVRKFASWVPEPLAAVVSRALRRNPEERYQDVTRMQRDLLVLEDQLLVDAGAAVMDLQEGAAERSSPPSSPSAVGASSGPSSSSVSSASSSRRSASRGASGATAKPLVVRPSRELAAPKLSRRPSRAVVAAALAVVVSVLAAAALLFAGGVFGGSTRRPPAAARPATDASAGPSAIPAPVPPASPLRDAAGPADAAAIQPWSDVVRITIQGVPRNGRVRVGQVPVVGPPWEVVVPRSDRPLTVVVDVPQGAEVFRTEVVPSEDRVVGPGGFRPPRLPAEGPRDGGAGARDAGRRPQLPEELPL